MTGLFENGSSTGYEGFVYDGEGEHIHMVFSEVPEYLKEHEMNNPHYVENILRSLED